MAGSAEGRSRARRINGWRAALLLAVLTLAVLFHSAEAAVPADRIWFCPGPGTLDYVRLFQHPEEWPHTRLLFSVFKFYQQHTMTPAPEIVGPNSYDAFVRANAFQLLNRWGKKIAIEVGAVKEFYCTPDSSGMNAAIAASIASIRSVQNAGGTVTYLAMDEPFVSGRSKVCGGPALEPTADRVATYVTGVRAVFPTVQIGLIEAYPFSSADAIETIVQLLKARNVTPSFLHLDVDLQAMRDPNDFARDMTRLKASSAAIAMPFGIIVWGNNGDSDTLYAADAERLVQSISDAFANWPGMPEHIILQSWAVSSTGARITPVNLPEGRAYTHTNLLWSVFRRLRGQTGKGSDIAVRVTG